MKQLGYPSATWATNNPIIPERVLAIETDTHKLKVGDGETAWNDLSYLAGSGSGDVEEAPEDGKQYARQDGAWEEVVASGGGLDPSDIDTVSLSDSDSKVPSSKLMGQIISELPSGGIEDTDKDKPQTRVAGGWVELNPRYTSLTGNPQTDYLVSFAGNTGFDVKSSGIVTVTKKTSSMASLGVGVVPHTLTGYGQTVLVTNPAIMTFGIGCVAVGNIKNNPSNYSVSIGNDVKAGGTGSVHIGYEAATSKNFTDSVIIGQAAGGLTSSNTACANVVAIGRSAIGSAANSVAVGGAAQAKNENSVALGRNSSTTRNFEVSIGSSPSSTRLIANVSDGLLDTDAVNYRQLQTRVHFPPSDGKLYGMLDGSWVEITEFLELWYSLPITHSSNFTVDHTYNHKLVLVGHASNDIEVTLSSGMGSEVQYVTFKNTNNSVVTFYDDAGTPNKLEDTYGFSELHKGNIVTAIWDGTEWTITGGLD